MDEAAPSPPVAPSAVTEGEPELTATTPLMPPESRPGMRGGEGAVDWFCTGRLRAASEDHRTSWKVFMAEVPMKLEGVKGLMEQVRAPLGPHDAAAHPRDGLCAAAGADAAGADAAGCAHCRPDGPSINP